mmetsp:Transcript_166707/g.320060  ORF Transcript_166707/g.320060 Transcript_166707/m.320060 type:complete len:670 (-) Transcript_166707:298-2307(-)
MAQGQPTNNCLSLAQTLLLLLAAMAPSAPTLHEFTRPLSVVDAMFAQHLAAGNEPASQFGEREYFQKVIGVENEEGLARIPCLNDVELAESVPPFTLVRYRGLVQDVFEPEIYAAVFQQSAAQGSGASAPHFVTSKYRDCVEPAPGCVLQQLDGPSGLGQRGACYCVPLPGETPWARAAAVERTSLAGGAAVAAVDAPVTPNRSNKRGRADEDVEMGSEENQRPRMAEAAPAAVEDALTPKKLAAGNFCTPCTPADNTMRTAEDFGLNFPIPSEEKRGRGASSACIVKLYDADAESLKPCEAVEIIGVLCVNPEVADFSTTSMQDEWRDARQPSTSLVPRLHALVVRHLPFYTPLLPYTNAWLSEARLANAYQRQFSSPGALATARNAAVALLTSHLGGDTVAAEYVLMQLVSRSFGRHGDKSLGSWSLNIAGWPAGGDTQSFTQAVAELVPRAVRLEVTADSLNTKRWRPQKDYVANRLVASQLQLAAGTLLVLDEMRMAAGNLGTEGVKALAAIKTLVTENLLTCDFMSCDVKLPLEVSAICVSERRSIVKDADVLLPLRPAASPVEASVPGVAALNAARWLIALVTRAPRAVKIPDHVAQRFSEDFAAVRQELSVPAELGHTWMGLARARCLTLGEKELSIEQWGAVFQLEKERLQRCNADGLLVQ